MVLKKAQHSFPSEIYLRIIVEAGVDVGLGGDPCGRLSPLSRLRHSTTRSVFETV